MSGIITSEDELIRTYLAPLTRAAEGAFALTDDCAVLVPSPGTDIVLTTDAVAAGVHFFSDDPPEDIAWKALAVNVSDLAASAATPRVYQMALSFPDAPTHAVMQRFADGLAAAQAAFGIVLSGGDTDRRPGPMTVTITAIGDVPSGFRLTRDGAGPGDALYVTGTLGDAACGLKLRRKDSDTSDWPLDDAGRADLLARYLRPTARIAAIPLLRRLATAAMDISDGLAKDLGRLASAARCGAIIEADRLPLSNAVRRLVSADASLVRLALAGGDDYEILFTASPDAEAEIAGSCASIGVPVTRIGHIVDRPGIVLRTPAGDEPLHPSGWDHF